MSTPATRWILWSCAALTLPAPVLLLGPGWVPPLRLLELGIASVAFMLLENPRGAAGPVAALLLGQAALYLALLWGLARIASRGLGRLRPRVRASVTWAVVAGGLALSASFEIYQTPFAADSPRASLLRVFR
jgi:hypothetical protein